MPYSAFIYAFVIGFFARRDGLEAHGTQVADISGNIAFEAESLNEAGISLSYSKRALQLAVAVGGLVPNRGKLAGMLLGPGMVDSIGGASIPMDSHYRYLSGLLLGIGLGFG